MAVEKDWTVAGADQLQGRDQPCATRDFASGDASNWCKHKAPGVYQVLTIENDDGAADLYVSMGPARQGAASGGAGGTKVPAGTGRVFSFKGGTAPFLEYSTWGEAGASHAMTLTFEIDP